LLDSLGYRPVNRYLPPRAPVEATQAVSAPASLSEVLRNLAARLIRR
jgi:hypothetical protein